MSDRIRIQRRKQISDSYSCPQLATNPRDLRMRTAQTSVIHDISRISLRPQAQLTVSQPGDFYEQEADKVANLVMSMGDSSLQQQTTDQEEDKLQLKSVGELITPLVQREEIPGEEEEEETLQMKPAGNLAIQREEILEEEEEELIQAKSSLQRTSDEGLEAQGNIASSLQSRKGGGSALPDEVKSFMKPRFGADFSNVKVHTDSQAVQMATDLGAQAFTYGNDIYYGGGKVPGKDGLTAHELTHVLQQGGGSILRYQDANPYIIQNIIQRVSFAGAASETACALMSDEQIYSLFIDVYFSSQPNARQHLIHYRTGGGNPYDENVEALFSANPRIRSRIAELISEQVTNGDTQGALIGKGVDDGGDPPIRQSDYDSEDWRNANGNIDEVRWRLIGEYKPSGYNQIQITVVDPYTWHPMEARPTQCLHAAFEGLKSKGAADYITTGTATIMLPPVQQSPDVPIESEY